MGYFYNPHSRTGAADKLWVCANQVIYDNGEHAQQIATIAQELNNIKEPIRKDVMQGVRRVLGLCPEETDAVRTLRNFYDSIRADNKEKFSSHLHSESHLSAMKVEEVHRQHICPIPRC